MHAIPTMYRNRVYRSRLEARWAAMFDSLGWRYEYEPFDLAGWIPDFILLGERNVLVEVKPIMCLEGPAWIPAEVFSVAEKVESATRETDDPILVLGGTVLGLDGLSDDAYLALASGYMFGWVGPRLCERQECERPDMLGRDRPWQRVEIFERKGQFDLVQTHAILDRGGHESLLKGWVSDWPRGPNFRDFGSAPMHLGAMWAEAGNATQWKAPARPA